MTGGVAMRRVSLVVLVFCIIAIFGCLAQAEDMAGTAAFMNMGFGARSLGMGGVGVAVTDDSSAVYHNPAALAFIEDRTITSGYSRDWAQVSLMTASVNMSGFGLGVMNLQANNIDISDEFGDPSGTFNLKESVAMVGYGIAFDNGLAVGVSGKYYKQTLSNKSAQGMTVDAGVLFKQGDFTIGVSARNLFGKVKDSLDNEDPFDRKLIVGGAWAKDQLVIGIDMDLAGAKRIGAEYDFGMTKVRVGGYLQDNFAFTLGLGLNVDTFSIDYAYLAQANLPATHRFSVVFAF
jgi:hypothetical protein